MGQIPEWQGQPGGVTGAVLLAESHLAIHTWPETGNVTIDVYVCNFSGDNSAKAQALMDGVVAAYAPQEAVRQQLWRGDIATNGVGQYPWVMEQLTGKRRLWVSGRTTCSAARPFQTLEMLDTPSFGRVMRLDDHFMTSEGKSFYHECMAHPAAMAHPRSAAGAGDWRRRWRLGQELLKAQHRAAPGAGRAGRGRHRGQQGPAARAYTTGCGTTRACSCKLATAWPMWTAPPTALI